MEERLQKYLARCGVASRRQAEVLISQGKVTVNGDVTTVLGTKVDPARATVTVDGRPVSPPVACTYLACHKPAGYLTTRHDPHGRSTVYDLLPAAYAHLKPVGRLDYQSEGLLFLTNDGAWAHRVAHPRYGGEKEYAVLVNGALTAQQLATLRAPMILEGYRLNPVAVELLQRPSGSGAWIGMTLTEGRKRQIRHMLALIGKHAVRLVRTRIGPAHLADLAPGERRPLTRKEIAHWRGHSADLDPERAAPVQASAQGRARSANAIGRDRTETTLAGTAIGTKNGG